MKHTLTRTLTLLLLTALLLIGCTDTTDAGVLTEEEIRILWKEYTK